MKAEEVLIKAGLRPYKDGDQWCILLGDNIQEGICGFGNTIDDALYEFLNDLIKSQKEQKPTWSEEDEKYVNDLTAYFTSVVPLIHTKEDIVNWLKSLRPQKQDVMSVDEFRHIVGYLVQDIVANEHMVETEKQPTNFFVEKYYNKIRPQSHWQSSDADTFIEKAVRRLEHYLDNGMWIANDVGYREKEAIIEDFRRYLEE